MRGKRAKLLRRANPERTHPGRLFGGTAGLEPHSPDVRRAIKVWELSQQLQHDSKANSSGLSEQDESSEELQDSSGQSTESIGTPSGDSNGELAEHLQSPVSSLDLRAHSGNGDVLVDGPGTTGENLEA